MLKKQKKKIITQKVTKCLVNAEHIEFWETKFSIMK